MPSGVQRIPNENSARRGTSNNFNGSPGVLIQQFGLATDKPVPNAFGS
ncbi:MAG: hypothetical protein ABJA66_10525 [Actinomycetota bacterium]